MGAAPPGKLDSDVNFRGMDGDTGQNCVFDTHRIPVSGSWFDQFVFKRKLFETPIHHSRKSTISKRLFSLYEHDFGVAAKRQIRKRAFLRNFHGKSHGEARLASMAASAKMTSSWPRTSALPEAPRLR